MAWQDALQSLRDELAEARSARQRQFAEDEVELGRQREQLTELAGTLGILELLTVMNDTLLEGGGNIETIVSWDDDAEDPDPEDEEQEEGDAVTTVLSWEEAGEREVAVDLGLADEGTYLQVNGVDIRLEREALEQALIEAFRDELEL